jgi:hypothetical protein
MASYPVSATAALKLGGSSGITMMMLVAFPSGIGASVVGADVGVVAAGPSWGEVAAGDCSVVAGAQATRLIARRAKTTGISR